MCISAVCSCDRTPDIKAGHLGTVGTDPGPPGPAPAETSDWAFRNITDWAGVSVPSASEQGASFIDADRDGIDDIVLPGQGQTTIFRGRGDGSFYPFTIIEHPGILVSYPYVLDWSRDGIDDLVLADESGVSLARAIGDGTYEWVGDLLRDGSLAATVVSFADFNNDQQLDLYMGRMNVFDPDDPLFGDEAECGAPGDVEGIINRAPAAIDAVLYSNNTGWGYASGDTGLLLPLYTQAVTAADIDMDGTMDLLVGTEGMRPDVVFRGNADGTFTDLTAISGMTLPTSAMGYEVVDIDSDGDLDIYVTDEDTDVGDKLYIQVSPGKYIAETKERGLSITRQFTGWGIGLHDLDHDADLDLFVANGIPLGGCPGGEQENLLFLGETGGYFERLIPPPGGGLDAVLNSRAAVFSDIDLDGDLDILVSNVGTVPTLLRNDLPRAGSWLQILLQHPTLSPVVGASITLSAGGITHRRAIHGTPSYGGSSTQWLHFGLGNTSTANDVTIQWPDGSTKALGTVKTNQRITVAYGE
ncbi:MAG: CRTAC1 family protein [Myxococcota bacterium]|nr:CRTAC1 family protein [Myxococcota bacterium]